MSLGAQKGQILLLVLKQGLIITGIGLSAGIVVAALITRYFEKMLFGLNPVDISTFMTVSAVFVTTAIVACYLPARRAACVDPLVALRHE